MRIGSPNASTMSINWRKRYDELLKDYDRMKILTDQYKAKATTQSEVRRGQQYAPRGAVQTREPQRCYGCGGTALFKRDCLATKSQQKASESKTDEGSKDCNNTMAYQTDEGNRCA